MATSVPKISETSGAETSDDKRPQLDASAYQSRAIVEQLAELLGVSGTIRRIVMSVIIVTVSGLAASYLVFTNSEWSGSWVLLFYLYTLIVGVMAGAAIGILSVLRSALGNIEQIAKIALQTTCQATADFERLEAGNAELPNGTELFAQMFQDVFVPSLEQAVSIAFGPLGHPLSWAFRNSIGRALTQLGPRLRAEQLARFDEEKFEQVARSALAATAGRASAVRNVAEDALKHTDRLGAKIRFYALLPAYVAFTCLLILATAPLIYFAML